MFSVPGTGETAAGEGTPSTPRPESNAAAKPEPSTKTEPNASNDDKDKKPSKVKRVALTSDVASPQPAGTTITLKAEALGGVGPYLYQWRVFDGKAWSQPTEWADAPTFTWTPTTAISDLGMMVGVKSARSVDDAPEARGTITFVIKPASDKSTPAADEKP
jgi:hypothetical protein